MANYMEASRSNFFRVKNEELFKFSMDSCGVNYSSRKDNNGENHYGIFEDEYGEGGFPSFVCFDDEERIVDIGFKLEDNIVHIIFEVPESFKIKEDGKISISDIQSIVPSELKDSIDSVEKASNIEGGEFELDIAKEVSSHLQDGSVAVFMYSGHEKMRYIAGGAYSVDNKGNSANVNLDDIYELSAQKMGVNVDSISKCEYEDIRPAEPSAEISNS